MTAFAHFISGQLFNMTFVARTLTYGFHNKNANTSFSGFADERVIFFHKLDSKKLF